MKKLKKALCLVLALILLCFSACGKGDTKKDGETKETISETDKYSHILTSYSVSEKGAYIIEASEPVKDSGTSVAEIKGDETAGKKYSLIKFIDNASLKEIVLCNKPGCAHSDSSCNAAIPSPFNISKKGNEVRFPIMHSVGYIFELDEKLYTFDPLGDITAMNKDGTEHQKILTVDGKYKIDRAYLYKGKLYFDVRYLPPFDSNEEASFSDKDNNVALLEIDLEKRTCKELFSFKFEPETEMLGIYENTAYYFYKSPNKLLSSHNQQAVDNEENGHDVKLFAYDLLSGERQDIKKDIKSYEFDAPVLIGNSVYYQSRKTSEFISLNLDNGENKAAIKDFGGYIEYFAGNTFFDGKLFFVKNNQLSDAFADPPKENEAYYIDIKTNEVKKADYSYRYEDGFAVPLRSFRAVTNDYYLLYKDGTVLAIKKEDFYNNKQNFVTVK